MLDCWIPPLVIVFIGRSDFGGHHQSLGMTHCDITSLWVRLSLWWGIRLILEELLVLEWGSHTGSHVILGLWSSFIHPSLLTWAYETMLGLRSWLVLLVFGWLGSLDFLQIWWEIHIHILILLNFRYLQLVFFDFRLFISNPSNLGNVLPSLFLILHASSLLWDARGTIPPLISTPRLILWDVWLWLRSPLLSYQSWGWRSGRSDNDSFLLGFGKGDLQKFRVDWRLRLLFDRLPILIQ